MCSNLHNNGAELHTGDVKKAPIRHLGFVFLYTDSFFFFCYKLNVFFSSFFLRNITKPTLGPNLLDKPRGAPAAVGIHRDYNPSDSPPTPRILRTEPTNKQMGGNQKEPKQRKKQEMRRRGWVSSAGMASVGLLGTTRELGPRVDP